MKETYLLLVLLVLAGVLVRSSRFLRKKSWKHQKTVQSLHGCLKPLTKQRAAMNSQAG